MDLRTRYSELTTLTSQYIKFISETLRRMEAEAVAWGRVAGGRVTGWGLEVGVGGPLS